MFILHLLVATVLLLLLKYLDVLSYPCSVSVCCILSVHGALLLTYLSQKSTKEADTIGLHVWSVSGASRASLPPVRASGSDVRNATHTDERAWLQGHENVLCFSNSAVFWRSAEVEYLSLQFSCVLSYWTSVTTACSVRTSASSSKMYRPL
jgi:hypothetical protein